jgi:hypothetical protein
VAAGAAVVTAASGIKLSAALALPFLAVAERPTRRVVAGIVTSAALLAGIGLAVFGPSLVNMGDAIRLEQHYGIQLDSVPGFAAHTLGLGPIQSHGQLALKLLFAAASAGLWVRCIRDRNWLAATGWSMLVLLGTLGWVLAWYILWLLPFAALARSRLLLPATVALTLAITVVWASHYGTSYAGHPGHHRQQQHHHRPQTATRSQAWAIIRQYPSGSDNRISRSGPGVPSTISPTAMPWSTRDARSAARSSEYR